MAQGTKDTSRTARLAAIRVSGAGGAVPTSRRSPGWYGSSSSRTGRPKPLDGHSPGCSPVSGARRGSVEARSSPGSAGGPAEGWPSMRRRQPPSGVLPNRAVRRRSYGASFTSSVQSKPWRTAVSSNSDHRRPAKRPTLTPAETWALAGRQGRAVAAPCVQRRVPGCPVDGRSGRDPVPRPSALGADNAGRDGGDGGRASSPRRPLLPCGGAPVPARHAGTGPGVGRSGGSGDRPASGAGGGRRVLARAIYAPWKRTSPSNNRHKIVSPASGMGPP